MSLTQGSDGTRGQADQPGASRASEGSLRVAILGPVLPFRGGIAHYTTLLARTLGARCTVRTFSFARQYPALLFPGDSDRDPEYAGHVEPGTSYALDTVNPLTWRRTASSLVDWDPDLVVLPWWHVYFSPVYTALARHLTRRGIPLVFLCHNVVEHETAAWRRGITRRILRRGSAFIVHTQSDRDELERMLPGAEVRVHPVPLFDSFPTRSQPVERARSLELLFFGFVRPYKGLDVLAEAMRLLDPALDVRLTVVGEFWSDAATLRAALAADDRIVVIPRYVTEAEAAEHFQRADLAVLPYRSATGSAVVAVAFHYGVPVLATRVGGLPDVVIPGRTGLLVDPESPEQLAEAIVEASRVDLVQMSTEVRRFAAEHMSWESLADDVLGLAARHLRVRG